MIVVYVEISKKNGFIFAVYDETKKEAIYGDTSNWNNLRQRVEAENDIRYKVYLDSMVRIDELLDDEIVDQGVIDKTGIAFVNPFDSDEGGEDAFEGDDIEE